MKNTKCPDCGHNISAHTLYQGSCAITVNNIFCAPAQLSGCKCTRTYESLTEQAPEPDTTLELLIVDLGGQCLLKVVQGVIEIDGYPYGGEDFWHFPHNNQTALQRPFTELRKAIESNAPVPRIEQVNGRYDLWFYENDKVQFTSLSSEQYEALCALAGKEINLHKGGTWRKLSSDVVTVWEYKI